MSEINPADLDSDHWATSEAVRTYIDIPIQGDKKDVETYIISATDSIQADWKEATDGDIPDDLPETDDSEPNQIEEENALLVRATALLAASEAHESEAQQIRSEDGEDKKHIFLERRAESKFDDWVTVNGYGETDTNQKSNGGSLGSSASSSLVDLG